MNTAKLRVIGNTGATGTPPKQPPHDGGSGVGEGFAHRTFLQGPFWQRIPAYAEVNEATFLDHHWQAKHSVTSPAKLRALVQDLAPGAFLDDVEEGFRRAPMSMRVSPYLLALMSWEAPYEDPLRRQFIPVGRRLLPDHPKLGFDSLGEQADSPVPGLTHRYPDKVLFLPLNTCPVYCRFCTRSYAVGIDTEMVDKLSLKVNEERWRAAFTYLAEHPAVEDVVVSGGDAYQLRPQQLREIGEALLAIPHIRRIRFATKGLAVMPQKILTDGEWLSALTDVVTNGRRLHKEVVMHTHFNHPTEITWITERAATELFERGITVRNQTVLQRGVNDETETMRLLVKRLAYVHVHPYYVYMHDLVRGVEDLRTTLQTALDLEKDIRGSTAGFHTPTFVVDAPGGGGKRDAHSFEHYDRTTGISVYTSPAVRPGRSFLYFDPIDLLPQAGQRRWADPAEHDLMVAEALAQKQQ